MIDIALAKQAVAQGDVLSGTAAWTPARDASPGRVQVKLCWRTEGGHMIISDTVAMCECPYDRLKAGDSVRFPFEFQIPFETPVSYEAALTKLVWYIQVVVERPWATDPSEYSDFRVTGARVKG